jgi:hypothetical protein
MVGGVIEARARVAPESRVSWNWAIALTLKVWLAVIDSAEEVNVRRVATLVSAPPSQFHQVALVPIPLDLPQTPLHFTVTEVP